MLLAELLKRTRQKAFLSQEAFANIIGTSVSTINRWENGKCKPSLSAMKEIKSFCDDRGLSYEDLEEAWFMLNDNNEE